MAVKVASRNPAAVSGDGAPGAPGASVLEVDGAGVTLGGRQILTDVRFSIGAGEFVGLIGSNGAGKTTLLRLILGLQQATSGAIRIAGRAGAHGRGMVGYVPQKIQLDADMPVRARDLVALGLDGNRLGLPLPSRRKREAVDGMLAAVDASRFANERVGNLSGGEQQRVMIAHALVSKPRLLLLDEPLANLDIRSAQEIIALLARITREQQVSVLISAHEMNPLLPAMDRIVYLAGGRAASGTTDEVIREDVLSALYGHHVDVLNVHGRVLVIAHAGEGFEVLAGDETAAAAGHADHAPAVIEP
ncbi:MAG TPA: metal ABC transporter ATP-binding protein [Streptosporangiaceae bacterium]|jgi:zinc/manganese transport system ATP-binding protein